MARDIAKTPRTLAPSQYITRPPASCILFNSSGRSGCERKQKIQCELVSFQNYRNVKMNSKNEPYDQRKEE